MFENTPQRINPQSLLEKCVCQPVCMVYLLGYKLKDPPLRFLSSLYGFENPKAEKLDKMEFSLIKYHSFYCIPFVWNRINIQMTDYNVVNSAYSQLFQN